MSGGDRAGSGAGGTGREPETVTVAVDGASDADAYLTALLAQHGGNIRAAARVDRVHLYRLLARHGLRRDEA